MSDFAVISNDEGSSSTGDAAPPDKREAKREAFRRLAERRTNAVLEKIRVLSNCSNPYAYEYSEEDVKQIFGAIEQELRVARGKFKHSKPAKFRLS
jgi:hypothetical protein